jgi:hypothetical protein
VSFCLSACGGETGISLRETAVLSDGSVLHTYDRLAVRTLEADTLWTWDPWSGSEPFEFSSIEEVLALDGRLAVTDTRAAAVVLVDPASPDRETWGRSGSGPGEFRNPAYLARTDEALWVSDMRQMRFSLLDRTGRPLREVAWPRGVSRLTQFGVLPDGSVVYHGYGLLRDPADTGWMNLVRYQPEGASLDTILSVESERGVQLALRMENGGQQTMYTYPLLVMTIRWDMDPRGPYLVTASDPGYRIDRRRDDGTVIASMVVTDAPVPGKDRVLDWWVEQGYMNEGPGAVLAQMGSVPLETSLREWPVASSPQAVRGLKVDPLGRLWVLALTGDPAVKRCDLYGPDFEYLGSFLSGTLPATFLEDGTAIIPVASRDAEPHYAAIRVPRAGGRKIPD